MTIATQILSTAVEIVHTVLKKSIQVGLFIGLMLVAIAFTALFTTVSLVK